MLVNMHEAKTRLSKLVALSLEGEEVIIAINNQPAVRLEPVRPQVEERKLGTLKGKIKMADDFDEPLDDFKGYQ